MPWASRSAAAADTYSLLPSGFPATHEGILQRRRGALSHLQNPPQPGRVLGVGERALPQDHVLQRRRPLATPRCPEPGSVKSRESLHVDVPFKPPEDPVGVVDERISLKA